MSKHNAERIPAQASQYIPLAQGCAKHFHHLAQHVVAGKMARGVVYKLELVQIDKTQRVLSTFGPNPLNRAAQMSLKGPTVDKPRKSAMVSLIAHLLRQPPGPGAIFKNYKEIRLVDS